MGDWTIGMCRGKEWRKLNENQAFRHPSIAVGRLPQPRTPVRKSSNGVLSPRLLRDRNVTAIRGWEMDVTQDAAQLATNPCRAHCHDGDDERLCSVSVLAAAQGSLSKKR